MLSQIEVLASYVPALLRRRLSGAGAPVAMPDIESHEAAVLFADISGFTRLSEQLSDRGPDGLEELTGALNTYFDRLIELIAAHGGDVIKMAGDALVAVWPTRVLGEPLASATVRAARCGLVLQATLQDYEVGEGIRLSSKVAIAAGDVVIMHVGGVYDRWEMLIAGTPMVQMGHAELKASPGEVIVSPEAWAIARDALVGVPLEGGFLRLTADKQPLVPRPLDSPMPGPDAECALRAYVPGAIRARLVAGQTGWLAELRQLTVLFVKFPPPDLHRPDALEWTQRVMTALQTAVYRYEGSVNKLSVDEKGTTLVAAFGLPPLAHEDDARRAIQAAQAIYAIIKAQGLRCAIGISTGRVYCGEVGNDHRREYTTIGRTVNLAARLMQAAIEDNVILCDTATARSASADFHFDERPAIRLKNIEQPVITYRPLGRISKCGGGHASVGRGAERAILSSRLDAVRKGRGGLLFVEGDAGIGKSRLVADLVEAAEARGVATLAAGGDAIERSSPYHAWRSLFGGLLGIDEADDPDERSAHAVASLANEPEWLRLAPLLNGILPVDLPEIDQTRHMIGQVRADNVNALLIGILRRAAQAGPTVVILEDAHWLDSSSWALTHQVIEALPEALFVVTARPFMATFPGEAARLLQVPGVQHLRLDSLDPEGMLCLACRRLGVDSLPTSALELILDKSQGNPFFCEELASALLDAGLLVVDEGRCEIASGVDLKAVSIPNHVEGVVNGRIDRLTPPQQLTLKVASIIGRIFAVRLLHDVYPIEPERAQLLGQLESLSGLELIRPDEPEPDLAYIFRHVITRDVVYDLMPSAQRRTIHRAVAEWYERTQGEDLAPFYQLLAYHWTHAHDNLRAIDYLEKAGEQALRGGAYQEAIGFFGEAFDRNEHARPKVDPARTARWDHQLGEAHLSLGNLSKSREHAIRTLVPLDRPVPSRVQLPAAYAAQIARQVWRRLRRARPGGHPAVPDATSRLASSAFGLIGQLCYFEQDRGLGVYAAIRALNLAEADGGSSVELARGLAVMCMASGLVPIHSLAEKYGRLAFAAAAKLDDLGTRAWVLQLTGMYYLGVGRWFESRENLEQAVALSRQLGDWRRWEESSGELARLDYCLGSFDRAADRFREFGEVARSRGHGQARVWSLNGQAKCLLRLGRVEEAHALLEESTALAGETNSIGDAILRAGLLAHVHRSREDWPAARDSADEVSRLIRHQPPIVSYTLEGYAGAAEAHLALWAIAARSGGGEPARAAWASVAALRKTAWVFPVGRPRAFLYLGKARWLAGQPAAARRAWRKALRVAEAMRMPFESGLAHFEIGRHLERRNPARAVHLERATSIFDELGSIGDRDRCLKADTE